MTLTRTLLRTFCVAIVAACSACALAPGLAVIEGPELSAEAREGTARIGSRELGGTVFEAIVLHVPGGMTLEILSHDFSAGNGSARGPHKVPFALASLQDHGTGRHFLAETGTLSIDSGQGGVIRGTFAFGMRNALSSCMHCPGTWVDIRGEFCVASTDSARPVESDRGRSHS